MRLGIAPAPGERRLLDEGRRTRAMLWVMAVMLFLTVLAAALGLGMGHATRSLDRQLAGRLTVQVTDGAAARREAGAEAAVAAARALPGVTRAEVVPPAELRDLLAPWLGGDGADASLPLPAMVDVDTAAGADVAAVEAALARAVPGARVDRNARWLSPVSSFLGSLGWLAVALVALLAAATAAMVVLTARTGLDTHRATIDVLHMLGTSDVQIAQLFQRRVALDTLAGGALGTAAAMAVVALIAAQAGALGSEALAGAALLPTDWLLLAALPVMFAGLAMLSARLTVLGALRAVL